MKIERLLTIVIMLLNRRKVTASQLADRFDVSVRTIYRDIETLNGSGIPVVSYQGYEGGFCIPDNYKLTRQLLTFNDMLSILTTLKGVNRTVKDIGVDKAIEKITALIPAEKEHLYRRHSDSFQIDIAPWGDCNNRQELISIVHRAVSDSISMSFDYTDATGMVNSREVEPHTLVYKGYAWYLLAFCLLRRGFRVFRLSRIRNFRLMDRHFVRREVDPRVYFQAENDSRPAIEVVLRFAARLRIEIEEIFGEDQLLYHDDNSITATFSVPEDQWVISMVLSHGEDVEILSPPHIREAVRGKIEKMKNIYRNLT